ncbi:MAG: cache domain-containing protein [Sediminispirochaetaceae bacterium]
MDSQPEEKVEFTSRSSVRFAAALATAVIAIAVLSVLFSEQLSDSIVEMRKQELKRIVTLGVNAIEPIRDKFEKGELSREEALEEVRDTVRRLVYDDPSTRNYLFMSSYDGTMLVQPFEPDKEGTDQWDLQDSNGRYIIRKLVEVARRGSGFVEYYYPPPDRDTPERKISYVVGIDELSCYVGTGLYLYDINSMLSDYFRNTSLAVLLIIILFSFVLILLFRPYYSVYHQLLKNFNEIARNPDYLPQVAASPYRENSEVWLLMKNFRSMLEQLRQMRKQLENSIAEKENLLKEVHHRVKNNLQIVSSLLNLQSSSMEHEEQRKILQQSVVRIHSMALIHETIYSSEVFEEIDMARYIQKVTHAVFQGFENHDRMVNLRFELDEGFIHIDQAILCGLVITELVSNALSHAFHGHSEGTIDISFRRSGEAVQISVADNGRGANPELLDSSTDTLGITLVKTLTSQLEGTVELHVQGGSTFTVTFPPKNMT